MARQQAGSQAAATHDPRATSQQGSHCRQWVDPIAGKWIADQIEL
jgi:hypothetical protein